MPSFPVWCLVRCRILVAACLAYGCSPTSTVPVPAATPATASPAVSDPCLTDDPDALRECVQQSRIAAEVAEIAAPRPPGSQHWRRVQTRCAQTFAEQGFEVELHRYATGVNVIGYKAGTSQPESTVVVGAHYDHIPGCAGADDNASGVAGVLELARVLGPPAFDRSLVLACWDEEERGLIGSRAWAQAAREQGRDVVVYFNFDAIGFTQHEPDTQRLPAGFQLLFPRQVEALVERSSRADFIAVIADSPAAPFADAMGRHAEALSLPLSIVPIPGVLKASPLVLDLRRSDHASFWDAGYPAVMITDTANFRSPHYHCREGPDLPDSLDLDFLRKVVAATGSAVAQALQHDPTHVARPE